jgi:formylmethanofuran dehydrogenase subunit E
MIAYANDNGITFDDGTSEIINLFKHYQFQFIDTDMKETLKGHSFNVSEGQKVSRILNTIFIKFGFDKLPDYNKLYAKIADAFNPLTIKRTSVLSLHPCDYLHMSEGNGWNSCHNLNDGCYIAGTISYMTDKTTAIFYTINDGYQGDEYYNEPKITRNVFCYSDSVLLQSRLYPNNDEGKKKQYREIVQKIFSDCENLPNLWIKKDFDEVSRYIKTHDYAMHYTDYTHSDYRANISIRKNHETEYQFIIGSRVYCLMCGDDISNEKSLYCNDCADSKESCEDCGHRYYEDDLYYVNDGYYCRDCLHYCNNCNEHTRNQTTNVNGRNYCNNCLNEECTMCEDCDEWIKHDDSYYVDGDDKYICEYCYNRDYFCCDKCGESFSNDESMEHDGRHYCDSCYHDTFFCCDECGEVFTNSENAGNDNGNYCEDCYKENNNEQEAA